MKLLEVLKLKKEKIATELSVEEAIKLYGIDLPEDLDKIQVKKNEELVEKEGDKHE